MDWFLYDKELRHERVKDSAVMKKMWKPQKII